MHWHLALNTEEERWAAAVPKGGSQNRSARSLRVFLLVFLKLRRQPAPLPETLTQLAARFASRRFRLPAQAQFSQLPRPTTLQRNDPGRLEALK